MNRQSPMLSQESAYQKKYNVARSNLMLMIVLSTVNVLLALTGGNTYNLFSATVPYYAAVFGMELGFLPLYIVSGTTLAGYLLCWILSKRHFGWMAAALIMFFADTAALVYTYVMLGDVSGVLDGIIHAWVLYYLVSGVVNGIRLERLRNEEEGAPSDDDGPTAAMPAEEPSSAYTVFNYSTPLRRADTEVKFRILAEADASGHHICYRRVKRVNELVVDGHVYDEVTMLVETPHELTAVIAGIRITAGLVGACHSFIQINGQTVVKKLRLY